MSTMNRNDAIREDNAALDELARISEELETINLLIVHFRQRPHVIRKLAMIRARLLIAKSDALARRHAAGAYV